jgi:hypothetical protein
VIKLKHFISFQNKNTTEKEEMLDFDLAKHRVKIFDEQDNLIYDSENYCEKFIDAN